MKNMKNPLRVNRRPGLTGMSSRNPGVSPVRAVPDAELIETLVSYGMPLVEARALEHNDQARFNALRFWADVKDYANDAGCRERVDYCREAWSVMRRQGIIRDIARSN